MVLMRDSKGQRPDQIFYCTPRDFEPQQVLSHYVAAGRSKSPSRTRSNSWDCRTRRNRLPKAVQRTAPIALVLYSLTVLWFHRTGHYYVKFPDRPWYHKKHEPSFADMLSTLRRLSWQDKLRGVLPRHSLSKKVICQMLFFVSHSA